MTIARPGELKNDKYPLFSIVNGVVYMDSQQFKVKPVCPTCGSIQGIVTGDQPPGIINVYSSRTPLPGYPQYGRIHIDYTIENMTTSEIPRSNQFIHTYNTIF
jgi:hypothetical protein